MRRYQQIIFPVAIFGFWTLAASALAATTDYQPLVKIPGVNTKDFLQYLSGIYNFLISIVGILAMASLVYGGFRYLTSVGNPAAVEDAKDIINSAIVGLVLALSSWLILNTINPDVLVTNKKPGITGATGKYAYDQPPSTRDCVADTVLEGTPLPGDSTKKKCKCVDDPTKDVTFTPSTPPTGPYVVSTSITPCSTNVPVNTSPLIITFSEKMDPATIIGANFILLSGSLPFTVALDPAAQDKAILTLTTPLMSPALDELKISSNIKSAKGINLVSDYDLKFTTGSFPLGSCTPPPQVVVDCTGACSNPLTPGLTPPGYHCLKADLRVGKSQNDITSRSITAKVGETLYFDPLSYAKSGRPVVAWMLEPNNLFVVDWAAEYGCDVVPNICSFWDIAQHKYTPSDKNCTILNYGPSTPGYAYDNHGVYNAWLKIIDDQCNPSEDNFDITVEDFIKK